MDIADKAAANQEAAEQRMLEAHQQRKSAEDPEFDDQGQRICIDCGIIIPPRRVELVGAVRCIDCAGHHEEVRRRSYA